MRRLDATCAGVSLLAAVDSRRVVLATAVSLMLTSWAGAQTIYNWDPPPRANIFSTATNWTPTGPPGPTGEARFNTSASAYAVSFNTDPTNVRVRVGNDHVTFNLNGHTYTLTSTSTSSPSIMVGGITLVDDALLTLTNGTLAGQHAVIAPAIFQTAAGMIVDTGATLNLAGTFTIGKQKPGSLTIQNGGDVLSATGILGESGAGDGSVTVTGAGSTWSNSGSVYVGGQAAIDGGNGTLSITNQGLVDIGGTLKLWPGGTVALDGGTLRLQALQLAGGSFNWTSGTLHSSSDLSVESSGPLGGALAVDAGKALETDGNFYVGNAGNGTLDITAGGTIYSAGTSYIGNLNGSTGAVVVDGVNSRWETNGPLRIGANGGNGTLGVAGGAVVTSRECSIADGEVNIDGSTLVVRADLSIQAGSTLHIFNDGLVELLPVTESIPVPHIRAETYIGPQALVTVDGLGSRLLAPGVFTVAPEGELHISSGGSGEVLNASILGFETLAHSIIAGTLTVDTGATFSTEYLLEVNVGGPPVSVEIQSGGVIGSVLARIRNAVVTVNGAGSSLNANSLTVADVGTATLSITNGGTVSVGTLVLGPLGEIKGNGNIVGILENGGMVSPGISPGALNIDGNYTQTADGELLIELAPTSYDQLLITGDATLAGTLTVSLIEGFVPTPGQSFTFLTSDDVDGTFATEVFPSVPNLGFDVIYNAQSVVLTIVPALSGDYNADGTVDAADYVVWRKNDGTPPGYDTWRAHFGQTAGSGTGATGSASASAAVPEPTSLAPLLLPAAVAMPRRPRRAVSPKLAVTT